MSENCWREESKGWIKKSDQMTGMEKKKAEVKVKGNNVLGHIIVWILF